MPPKKNNDISRPAKITKEKVPRKRKLKENPPKPEKPKLKIPTVVRMKLPSIKSFFSSDQNQSTVQNTPKTVANKGNVSPVLSPAARRKIDLANEVALAQLVKPSPESKPRVEEAVKKKVVKKKIPKPSTTETKDKVKKKVPKLPVIDTDVKVPKKRGRKKKVVVEQPVQRLEKQSSDAPTNTTEESVPVPRKKRAYVRRKPLISQTKKMESKSMEQDTPGNETSIMKADSTSTPAQKSAVKRQGRRKTIKNVDSTNIDNIQPEAQVTPKSVVIKKKGKNNLIDRISTTNQSPSLLDEAIKQFKNDVVIAEPNAESKIKSPCPVDSRKTSICASECLSWTKDISSSSTTTCQTVTSNDFFRIDKKVPIIKLSHVENEWKNISSHINNDDSDSESRSSSSSCSSSSSSSSSSSQHESSNLNLSTSTTTPTKSDSTKDDDWEYALQKLDANYKKLDIEAINWCGYLNKNIDTTINITQNKIFKILKFENDLLRDCENMNNFFKAKSVPQSNDQTDDKHIQQVVDDPNSYTSRSEEDENFTTSKGKYVMFDQNCAAEEDPMKVAQDCDKSSEDDIFNPDKMNYASYDQGYNNDDDDTLSLFAESITGIESSRINSSANSICANPSEFEEYIPLSVAPSAPVSIPYVPTKIVDEPAPNTNTNLKSKTVCEKQNADSTSIHREKKQQQSITPQNSIATSSPVSKQSKPVVNKMMSDIYRPIYGVKSTVFRQVCFFNLISNCKKIRCVFPHVQPENSEIRNRLAVLSDEVFVQEYMLLRVWPTLRRRYGICYVSECIERKLTRILVEMSIDFISKAKLDSVEDAAIKINVTERTLMYLNTVDLSECADLLQYDFGKRILLCDVLMQTIGETQNFSRFKAIFVKLTDFITGIGGKFQLKVASQILERVCILPCEEALAYAVLAIVKNTDPNIFENSMMSQFEKQLSSLDMVLYGKLCTLRQQAEEKLELQRSQNSNGNEHSLQTSQEVDHLGLMRTEREERYTSPDTTKMDNSNKPPEDSMPQTVIIRPSIFNHIFQNESANSSPSSEEDKRPAKFRNWRGNSHNQSYMRNQNLRFNRPPIMRPPMRRGLKRHSDQRNVVFGSMPTKFPRRSGPDFF